MGEGVGNVAAAHAVLRPVSTSLFFVVRYADAVNPGLPPNSMKMNCQPTAYDEKFASILTAAARIFAEKGYHNASIRDVARAAGVSLSGLYYYFQSKEELLYLVQENALAALTSRLESRLTEVVDPELKIRILIENQLTFFVSNMAEMKVLSHEADSLSGHYRRLVSARKRHLTSVAADVLRELRPANDFDPRVATFALFGMLNWLYNWYRPERDAPIERLVDEMTRIFLFGYLASAPTDIGAIARTPALRG